MHNKYRGEISAILNGERYRLCLSLGALAELESSFGASDLMALAGRFESGRLSANDAIRIIGAGLRGAGHDVGDEEVARMRCAGGAAGFVAIVVELLEATFGEAPVGTADENSHAPREGELPAPFPGTT